MNFLRAQSGSISREAIPRNLQLGRFVTRLIVCGILAHVLSASAIAQTLVEKEQAAFRQAAKSTESSVVQIETFGGLERIGENLIAEGPTTGTVIAEDGWIISSLFSFRQQPASILVTLPNGKRVPAEMIARDFSRELALLKIEPEETLQPVVAADPNVQLVGNWVLALGKTYSKDQVSQSVGIISAFGRAYGKAIQTDAKISPINYGGPLITLEGQTLGILAPISPGSFFEGDTSELYDSGIGFAIPTEDILKRLPRMQKGEDIYPGKLGIVVADQNEFNGPVIVSGATPGTPAAKSGLAPGDSIIEAAGSPVRILSELRHAIAKTDAGGTFRFKIQRDGQQLDLETELVKEVPVYRKRYLGLRLAQTNAGLKVVAVAQDSPAQKSNLKTEDILFECNAKPLVTRGDLIKLLSLAELSEPLNFTVRRIREADNTEAQSLAVDVTPVVWPAGIPATLPAVDPRIEDSMTAEVVDIPLGDMPNKTFTIVPPLSKERELGLLVVLPEPGDFDTEKFKSMWESFSRDQGWIVMAVQSGNPRGWSMEEAELVRRILGRLDNAYKIDPLRTVVGGIGVGGRLALLAGATEKQRISGILTMGTKLEKLAIRQQNAPMESLNFLLVGDEATLKDAGDVFDEGGYPTFVLPADIDPKKIDTIPVGKITLWLEGLGRL